MKISDPKARLLSPSHPGGACGFAKPKRKSVLLISPKFGSRILVHIRIVATPGTTRGRMNRVRQAYLWRGLERAKMASAMSRGPMSVWARLAIVRMATFLIAAGVLGLAKTNE